MIAVPVQRTISYVRATKPVGLSLEAILRTCLESMPNAEILVGSFATDTPRSGTDGIVVAECFFILQAGRTVRRHPLFRMYRVLQMQLCAPDLPSPVLITWMVTGW